jgi:hypothetical protein
MFNNSRTVFVGLLIVATCQNRYRRPPPRTGTNPESPRFAKAAPETLPDRFAVTSAAAARKSIFIVSQNGDIPISARGTLGKISRAGEPQQSECFDRSKGTGNQSVPVLILLKRENKNGGKRRVQITHARDFSAHSLIGLSVNDLFAVTTLANLISQRRNRSGPK